eukprot:4294664-Alexandrium_andersonii.AAC.1
MAREISPGRLDRALPGGEYQTMGSSGVPPLSSYLNTDTNDDLVVFESPAMLAQAHDVVFGEEGTRESSARAR